MFRCGCVGICVCWLALTRPVFADPHEKFWRPSLRTGRRSRRTVHGSRLGSPQTLCCWWCCGDIVLLVVMIITSNFMLCMYTLCMCMGVQQTQQPAAATAIGPVLIVSIVRRPSFIRLQSGLDWQTLKIRAGQRHRFCRVSYAHVCMYATTHTHKLVLCVPPTLQPTVKDCDAVIVTKVTKHVVAAHHRTQRVSCKASVESNSAVGDQARPSAWRACPPLARTANNPVVVAEHRVVPNFVSGILTKQSQVKRHLRA